MKQIVKYECEYCGNTFSQPERCLEHEEQEHGELKRLKEYCEAFHNDVLWFNNEGEPLTVSLDTDPEDIRFIIVFSMNGARLVYDLFEVAGLYSPFDSYFNYPQHEELVYNEIYICNDDDCFWPDNDWVCFSDLREQFEIMEEIRRKFIK